jgi:diaminopimelate decarboxylase/aspartate kinase
MSETKFSPWIVLKFGGTSVSSRERWETIATQVRARLSDGLRPVIVCSAISGVTNALEEILAATAHGHPKEPLRALTARHQALATALGVTFDSLVGASMADLEKQVMGAALIGEVPPRLRARVMAMGELMSTRLGAAFLNANGCATTWVDAREHLLTTDSAQLTVERRILHASCSFEADAVCATKLAACPTPAIVTQGFIARDKDGQTVLLGRGGSDTSAAYFAAKLSAKRCEIWTDVPGMFTADPRAVPSARVIRTLGFDEAQEISTMGAKVLHPRAIPPCRKQEIPLHIRCTPHPEFDGTVIEKNPPDGGAAPQVKAISTRKGIVLISMETVGMWQAVGFLADAFTHFKRHGLSIDLVSTSETNVTVSLDPSGNRLDKATIDALFTDLAPLCEAKLIPDCASVSLVGRGIRSILHELGGVLGLFEEQRIHLMSQAASDLNLTFVVDETQVDRVVSLLHGHLFGRRARGKLLGKTWEELFSLTDTAAHPETPTAWWVRRREELLEIAAQGSPRYVYDATSINAAAMELMEMDAVDVRFYAIKANPHPDVLRVLKDAGMGMECVSPGELDHVRRLFPDLDPSRLLFTPNFAGPDEYIHGFAKNAMVTVDGLHPLRCWPEIFADKEILLRMDPGKGRGHHAHVRTAGARSKFGISPADIDEAARLARAAGARVVGLHAHSGSGILSSHGWAQTAAFLAHVAQRFPDVRALDLGGGLGIAEKPGQAPLDLNAVNESLKIFKTAHPTMDIWLEPGRFLVAHAGVLLGRVTQLKQKAGIIYVGVNVGMNSLIRPALYGAHHPIINLTRLDQAPTEIVNIVGPICESGDVLGHARRLPPTKEGDVLLIGNAGAYGHSMASNYNLRPPATELLLNP